MSLTADALWLNTTFEGYDHAILSFAHKAAELLGPVLTPLNKLITLLGEKGLLFFLLAVVLMLIPRFRKTGVCIFGAVCCGALITNIILKDHIARPRPFETVDLFRQWWEYVGAPAEDGFSFPSGHVTAAAAGVTGLCLMRGRKWILPGAIWVLLMMFSRNYLMAHYPSDVLFALFIGVFSGFVAALITQLIFRFLESKRGEGAFWDFLLEGGIRLPSRSRRGRTRDDEEEEDAPARRPVSTATKKITTSGPVRTKAASNCASARAQAPSGAASAPSRKSARADETPVRSSARGASLKSSSSGRGHLGEDNYVPKH